MEKNKGQLFLFGIIALILTFKLIKIFNFEKFSFEKPAMAVVYFIAWLIAVYVLISNLKKPSTK